MRSVVVAALAAVLLTACAPGAPGPGIPGVGGVDVDVDTPELRKLRKQAGIEPCVSPTASPAADGLPEVTLRCLGGGEPVDVSRLRGPLVVNLLASWCKPCREELPVLQEFYARHGEKVPVLGVDWNDVRPDVALELARDSGVTFPLLADPETSMGEQGLRVLGMPTLILIDVNGDIAFQDGREIKDVRELEELVAEHLGVDL